ncbi:hypothetical protein HHK36_024180 [Tetracentron sinense]|uniref:Uncharacterized protein n=1 Tax=Tetracentron sinense TaxID=13715 RepID=A0A834YQ18_TETSI|nr:hypothetical protein HHK36_024180 [Tetracentron sinense]
MALFLPLANVHFSMEFSSGEGLGKKESQVPLRDAIGETGCSGDHGVEANVEFKPIDHPTEPPDEDWPVKCPMPDYSVLNEKQAIMGLQPQEKAHVDEKTVVVISKQWLICQMEGLTLKVSRQDGRMREERFAESLRKRVELSSVVSEEGIVVVATERPARVVRKRHHTLTSDHTVPPVFRVSPLPPLPTQSTANFQVLQQCNEFES